MRKTCRGLVAVSAMCLLLSGCGAEGGAGSGSGKNTETGGISQSTYTKDDLHLNFSATIDETTIMDEKGIKVTAKGLTYSNYSADLELVLENNTEDDHEFCCGTAGYGYNSINGFGVGGGYFTQDVSAGGSETVTASFPLDELTLLGFTDIAEIGLGIQVAEGLDVYCESGEVTIRTSAAGSYELSGNPFITAMDGGILPAVYEYTINKSEKDVYKNGDISIESMYVYTNKSGAQCVMVQTYNAGSEKAYVNSRDIYVNGEEVYEGIWSSAGILPGKRAILTIDLSRVIDDYEESDVTKKGADSIAFTFRLNDERGSEVWSEPITIEMK